MLRPSLRVGQRVALVHGGERAFADGEFAVAERHEGVDVFVGQLRDVFLLDRKHRGVVARHALDDHRRADAFDHVAVRIGFEDQLGVFEQDFHLVVTGEGVVLRSSRFDAEAVTAVGRFEVDGLLASAVIDAHVGRHRVVAGVLRIPVADDVAFQQPVLIDFRDRERFLAQFGERNVVSQHVVLRTLDDVERQLFGLLPAVDVGDGDRSRAEFVRVVAGVVEIERVFLLPGGLERDFRKPLFGGFLPGVVLCGEGQLVGGDVGAEPYGRLAARTARYVGRGAALERHCGDTGAPLAQYDRVGPYCVGALYQYARHARKARIVGVVDVEFSVERQARVAQVGPRGPVVEERQHGRLVGIDLYVDVARRGVDGERILDRAQLDQRNIVAVVHAGRRGQRREQDARRADLCHVSLCVFHDCVFYVVRNI